MKSVKFFLFIAICFFANTQYSFSQFSLGVQGSMLSLADNDNKEIGLGIRAEYQINERASGFLTATNYFKNTGASYNATATDGSSFIDVKAEDTYNVIFINLGAKYYLFGDSESSAGFYGLASAGYKILPYKTELESFDNAYTIDKSTIFDDETFKGFTINLGIGIDKKLPFGSVFLEGQVNLAANEDSNGNAIAVEIPNSTGVNLGVKFNIGG